MPPTPPDRVATHGIRLVIVDDHTILRQTLRLLLETRPQVSIVGEAGDGREAIELAEQLRPDVVLMDAAMPGLNGIDAAAIIRRHLRRTKVLMLSGYGYEDQVGAALRAGASGYVLKSSSADELVFAIQAVHQSNTYLSESLAECAELQTYLSAAGARGDREPSISAREREVLQLVAEGHTNQSIADRLVISIKTVEAHKEHISQKLGVRGTAGLIRYAIRKRLIVVESDAELGLSAAG